MKSDTIFRIMNEVAFRKANDGTLTIVSPVTDKITTVNGTASEIWYMIDGKIDVGTIVDKFIQAHKEDNGFPGEKVAKNDVFAIMNDFLHRELIEISGRKK
ncbi:MAG TPA: PqqD family protein [bacterium]|nr:PqqD family protein [bacterium]HQI05058.1 PqqD family protein [bacterium]HQN73246.1 PqqD family protein [bacterium]HQO91545.1 PqqD family protein [bacterium]